MSGAAPKRPTELLFSCGSNRACGDPTPTAGISLPGWHMERARVPTPYEVVCRKVAEDFIRPEALERCSAGHPRFLFGERTPELRAAVEERWKAQGETTRE